VTFLAHSGAATFLGSLWVTHQYRSCQLIDEASCRLLLTCCSCVIVGRRGFWLFPHSFCNYVARVHVLGTVFVFCRMHRRSSPAQATFHSFLHVLMRAFTNWEQPRTLLMPREAGSLSHLCSHRHCRHVGLSSTRSTLLLFLPSNQESACASCNWLTVRPFAFLQALSARGAILRPSTRRAGS
jgi:hypothetical protein